MRENKVYMRKLMNKFSKRYLVKTFMDIFMHMEGVKALSIILELSPLSWIFFKMLWTSRKGLMKVWTQLERMQKKLDKELNKLG